MLTGSPTIGSLSLDQSPVIQGHELTINALDLQDTGGTIQSVSFYLETTPGVTTGGELLGTATSATDWSLSVSTAGIPVGSDTIYAVATDDTDAMSSPAIAVDTLRPRRPR